MLRMTLATTAALTLVVAGCGDGDGTIDEIATLGAEVSGDDLGETVDSAGSDDEPELTFEEAQLEFAACMRETIPDWPDPDPDAQGGRLGFGPEALQELGIDPGSDDFRVALESCQENLRGVVGGGPERTAEEQAEIEDQLLSLLACVRGIPGFEDIPDPDFDGGAGFGLRQLVEAGDLDGEQLRAAMQQCQEDLGLQDLRGPGGDRPAGAAAEDQ